MDIIVKIDYTNILDNIESKLIGSGQRGIAIKYKDNIIKISKLVQFNFSDRYSDSNKYELTPDDNIKIEQVKKLYNITNCLKYFSKVKGYIFFPNITNNYNGMLKSYIYEDVGKLTTDRKELDKNISMELVEILTEFKFFNMSGFFHGDIQGCNNIELDIDSNLHVIDLDDVIYYEPNSLTTVKNMCIDLAKVTSCIESYNQNKSIIHTNNNIDFDIEEKMKKMIFERFNCGQLKFYDDNDNSNEIKFVKIYGLVFDSTNEEYINRLQSSFIEHVNLLKKQYTEPDDIKNFNELLELIENHKENKLLINNLLDELYEKKKIIVNDTNIITIYNKSLENMIITNQIKLKFGDTKNLIEKIYDEQIEFYKILLLNKYANKYHKYKNKYIELKNKVKV